MSALGRVAVIGLGLIGGSVGAALRRLGSPPVVVGFDAHRGHLERALALGLIDEAASSAERAVDRAQIVILAAPVRAIERIGEAVAASIPPGAFVTDVGSTKREIVAALDPLWPGRFVGGHPIAGTEHSGPEAADPALFEGRRVVLVRTERTGPDALASIDAMWRSIGVARVDVHEPAEHDRIFAAVSHLPHVAAFAICSALSDLPERELGAIEGFALAGFKDTTRIAGSDPRMWCDIFESNRDEVLRLVEILRERLGSLAGAIRAQDQEAVLMEIERARTMRRRVVGK